MTDPVKIIVGEGDITEVNVPEYNLIQTGGGGGSDGATFFPEVSQEGVISWTNDGGYDNPEPVNIKGPAGNDGSDGEDGEDGTTFTPAVDSSGNLSWTNDGGKQNPQTVNIKGPAGNDGNDGEDGEDGVSPTVTFSTITGGHTMTVTDKDHPEGQSINIMDGTSGGGGTSDYDDLTDKPSINNVTLSGNKTAAQLGLAAASDIPTVPVQSVNGKTGAVVLSASDVGAGTYSKPSGGIPKTDLASAVRTSLGKADTALQSAPVTSVNSKTGAVSLSASDVGALPDDTAIPSKTSDLTNDSGFLTSAPVTSVNNKTGAVTLTASDVGAGTYSKPSGGIPQTDLAQTVQNKLDKTVVVSDTQPTDAENKLWVDTDAGTGTSYQIPTVAEMETADAAIASTISNLNRYYSIFPSGTVSLANNTLTNIAELSVPSGIYLIIYATAFSNNSSGYRQAGIALSPTSPNINRVALTRSVPADGVDTSINSCFIYNAGDTTTFYLNARQNSGSDLTASGAIQAIKLK